LEVKLPFILAAAASEEREFRVMGQSGSQSTKIRAGEKEELLVTAIRLEPWKCVVLAIVTMLTFGLPVLLLAWRRDWKIALLYSQCSLREAKRILIEVREAIMTSILATATRYHGNECNGY